nr:hypothetical protein [Halosimplex rubrum]
MVVRSPEPVEPLGEVDALGDADTTEQEEDPEKHLALPDVRTDVEFAFDPLAPFVTEFGPAGSVRKFAHSRRQRPWVFRWDEQPRLAVDDDLDDTRDVGRNYRKPCGHPLQVSDRQSLEHRRRDEHVGQCIVFVDRRNATGDGYGVTQPALADPIAESIFTRPPTDDEQSGIRLMIELAGIPTASTSSPKTGTTS